MSTTNTAGGGRYAGQRELDAAVDELWRALRRSFPQLPELAPLLNARYPAEAQPTTAVGVAISILREAVHELAAIDEVTVTSRGGRYHNRHFAELAEKVGLVAEGDSRAPRGWASVSLQPETAERYAAELDELERVLAAHPVPTAKPGAPKRGASGRRVAAVCRCTPPHRIWLSPSTLDEQVVTCRVCAAAGRDPWFVDANTRFV